MFRTNPTYTACPACPAYTACPIYIAYRTYPGAASAQVVEVVSGDCLVIKDAANGAERRVNLSRCEGCLGTSSAMGEGPRAPSPQAYTCAARALQGSTHDVTERHDTAHAVRIHVTVVKKAPHPGTSAYMRRPRGGAGGHVGWRRALVAGWLSDVQK